MSFDIERPKKLRKLRTYLFLVSVSNHAKGIEKSKRRLGSKFILEGLEGRGGGGLLGGGESGGGGEEGGENSRLHLDFILR